MAVSQGTIPTQTSMPDIVQRHDISDEELEMLCEGKKDLVLEFLWIAIGIFIGALPSALVAMASYSEKKTTTKMPFDDLIQIVLFWVALVASVILSIVAYKRNNRSKGLQQKIRDRCGAGPI